MHCEATFVGLSSDGLQPGRTKSALKTTEVSEKLLDTFIGGPDRPSPQTVKMSKCNGKVLTPSANSFAKLQLSPSTSTEKNRKVQNFEAESSPVFKDDCQQQHTDVLSTLLTNPLPEYGLSTFREMPKDRINKAFDISNKGQKIPIQLKEKQNKCTVFLLSDGDKCIPGKIITERDNFEHAFEKNKLPTKNLANTLDYWQFAPPSSRQDCKSVSKSLYPVGRSLHEDFQGSKHAKEPVQQKGTQYKHIEFLESDDEKYGPRMLDRGKANCVRGVEKEKSPSHQQSTTTDSWQHELPALPINCISASNIRGSLTKSPRYGSVPDSKNCVTFDENVFLETMKNGSANVAINETNKPLITKIEPLDLSVADGEENNIGKAVALAREGRCSVDNAPLFISAGFQAVLPRNMLTPVVSCQPEVAENKVEEDVIEFLKFGIDEIDQCEEEGIVYQRERGSQW